MAGAPPSAEVPCTIIDARATAALLDVRELWRYRELLLFLAWRDLRVRYRQTLLGAGWALLEPLAGMLLFTLVFNRMAEIRAGELPYPLYCYAGLLLWTFFGRALRATTVSLVANAGLATKVYFPRLILPLAAQAACVADLLCALAMFFVLLAWYGMGASWRLATLPLWAGLAGLQALGVGLVLAAVNVRYRDVTQVVPLLTQVWMFATPVVYPLSAIPPRWLWVYTLNPLTSAVQGARWALLPDQPFDLGELLPSLVWGVFFLWVGLVCFRHVERRFADIV
jgi:lipopolysaccharide transport system permease protein